MKTKAIIASALLALLVAPALLAQDTDKEAKPQTGYVEFGIRHIWGDVYGRPDLPFTPSIFTSKYNEYRDIRNGFFLRRARFNADNFLNTNNYLDFQSDKSIYHDQSYLITYGRWEKFKFQIRYDEIPHV